MSVTTQLLKRKLVEVLEKGIEKGRLSLRMPDGETRLIVGPLPGSSAEWIIKDWQVVRAVAGRGDIGLGETYVSGMWEADNLEALLSIFIDNIDRLDRYANGGALAQFCFRILNYFIRRNNTKGSRENIRAHYDVGNNFYGYWLDKSMTYSSAIYKSQQDSLETAQAQKYRRILDRIGADRKSVLEIGCGWGGFMEAAVQGGHKLTGLTVSQAQHQFATNRLNGRADVRLEDYRHTKGQFEAIASIEMFEAVGMRYWPVFFKTIRDRLVQEGVALVQTITIRDEAFDHYVRHSDYIRHYVFPGGMLPSMQTFKDAAGQAGLLCRDVFTFGQDYARTLREWLERFEGNLNEIESLGYSEAFTRNWRFYMSFCAAAFACERTNVMQVELVRA